MEEALDMRLFGDIVDVLYLPREFRATWGISTFKVLLSTLTGEGGYIQIEPL